MGQYINKGNAGFRDIRNSEYVDKSGLIAFMNSRLCTENKFVCVTRARRFGKTLAANMLYAYYDKSCDSRSLFSDLEIAKMDGFEEHLNKFPVISLDISKFIDLSDNILNLIEEIERKVLAELVATCPGAKASDSRHIADRLPDLAAAEGEKFIIIIDEWDAPLRELGSRSFPCGGGIRRRLSPDEVSSLRDGYISLLRGLFKNDNTASAIAGAYITGILPMVRYNTQSALNNFKEYNLLNPKNIGAYLGFTGEEVRMLCMKHDMDFEQMQTWYDGYHVGELGHIFNPNSVMSAIDSREYLSYWTSTGAGEELLPYLNLFHRGDLMTLLEGGSIPVDVSSFNNTLDDITTADKLYTALIHLGYLSFDGWEARIPNLELMLYFGQNVANASDLGGLHDAMSLSLKAVVSMRKGDAAGMAKYIGMCHDDICGAQEYNSEQGLYTTLRIALYMAQADYVMHREFPSGKGFADLVLIPRPGRRVPAIVVELKNDKSAESAISQIKERKYPRKVTEYSGEIILVGINYNRNTKEHECSIERIVKG